MTRAKDISKILTDADISGNIDVDGVTNLDVVDIDGAVDMASTLNVSGVLTANAGIKVDNITIDGDQIDLSGSGDFTVDVGGDIILDTDGQEIFLKDDGTHFGGFKNVSSDFVIKSVVNDKDIIFQGTDGGTGRTALTLDMSDEGTAIFNNRIRGTEGSASAPMYSFTNDTNTGMFSPSGDIVGFARAGAEIMRMGLGLGIGTDATYAKLMINQDTQALNMITLFNTNSTHGGNFVSFLRSTGVAIGSINQNSAAGIVYNTSSDYRLKENVSYSFDATTRLKQLKPARFNWISDDTNTLQDGFLAHEVSSIVPEAITGSKDATKTEKGIVKDASGNIIAQNITETIWETGKEEETYADNTTWSAEATVPDYQQIDHSKLVPLLTKALQEQQATIEALTARIVTLENA